MTMAEVADLLYRQSGLLGVSGESSDMRTLLASNSHNAKFAIDLFIYRIQLEIGELIEVLEGLDCLIFTAGVGQNFAVIREMITHKFEWFGIKLDDAKNQKNEFLISMHDSKVKVFALPTNEEQIIVEEIMKLL